ncbi:hypothetical protein ASC95_10080 [Pelomonas sp. Root1217]|uniref:hypothetical protein n=1 Tax=Pelomonas sp. Root1217 TaxID=1736430 RepID=UPI00071016DC|nr:hypothetical protein [Pelomonas sp. Root1217]KQV53103.1 hypothetical protein ASC95_10080 [Pelomonas sp. Root1217]
MKRRPLLLLTLASPWAAAAPPAVPLIVELRWVDSNLPPAAQAAVRDGAVVVGTAGSISPRGAGVVTSTAAPAPQQIQRLTVLNGRRATLTLTTREPLQWVDAVVEIDPTTRTPQRVYASPRSAERHMTQSFTVTPNWPGGKAPVQVDFDIDQHDHAFQSTLQLPLDRWQTVARSGSVASPAPKGTLSSGDAAGRPERELQLRVSIQP